MNHFAFTGAVPHANGIFAMGGSVSISHQRPDSNPVVSVTQFDEGGNNVREYPLGVPPSKPVSLSLNDAGYLTAAWTTEGREINVVRIKP